MSLILVWLINRIFNAKRCLTANDTLTESNSTVVLQIWIFSVCWRNVVWVIAVGFSFLLATQQPFPKEDKVWPQATGFSELGKQLPLGIDMQDVDSLKWENAQ